jgi:hypothetical protein
MQFWRSRYTPPNDIRGFLVNAKELMLPYHIPGSTRILELPIYRCTEEQHYAEQEDRYELAAEHVHAAYRALGERPEKEKVLADHRNDWFRREGMPWDFNQIVGWIRLYTWTGNIRGYLFFASERITKVMRRKKFITKRGNFIKIRVFPEQSNEEILTTLKTTILAKVAEHTRLHRFYVDMGVLDVLGPHIDWIGLTKSRMHTQSLAGRMRT